MIKVQMIGLSSLFLSRLLFAGRLSETCSHITVSSGGIISAACTAEDTSIYLTELSLVEYYVNLQRQFEPKINRDGFYDNSGYLAWMEPPPQMMIAYSGSGGIELTTTNLDNVVFNNNGILECCDRVGICINH